MLISRLPLSTTVLVFLNHMKHDLVTRIFVHGHDLSGLCDSSGSVTLGLKVKVKALDQTWVEMRCQRN